MRLRRFLAVTFLLAAFVGTPIAASVDIGASLSVFFAGILAAACVAFWPVAS